MTLFRVARQKSPRILAAAPVGAAIAIALAATLGPHALAQPAQFSGAKCSLDNCDCSCIAGEEQTAARAIESLRVDLPPSLAQTPDRIEPAAALTRLRRFLYNIAHVQLLLQRAQADPLGATTVAEIQNGLPQAAAQLGLPAPPTGWRWDERYLESLERTIRTEIDRIRPIAENSVEIEKELNTCRQWADHKQCDPSLGVQAPTPPREPPPAPPPVVTPPRELPPADGLLPLRRHADGRPYVNDDLVTRYVAASQAKFREGGAYWRHGRMGQGDYDEISSRFQEYFRYENGPELDQRFDNAEVEVVTRRRAEINKAYYDNW